MAWSTKRAWKVFEPALPIVLWGMIAASDKVFQVHSDAGAALVGLGIAGLLIAIILVTASWAPKTEPRAWLTPLHLPWGVVFIVGGIVMMQLREPWKYDGFGVVVMGVLYLLLGTFAAVKKSRLSAR